MTSNQDPVEFIDGVIRQCNSSIAIAVTLLKTQGAPEPVMARVNERLAEALSKMHLHYNGKAKQSRLMEMVQSLKSLKPQLARR